MHTLKVRYKHVPSIYRYQHDQQIKPDLRYTNTIIMIIYYKMIYGNNCKNLYKRIWKQ